MWRPSWRPSWILKKPSGWQVATQQKTYLDIKYYGKIAKLDCNQTLQAFLELWDPATGLFWPACHANWGNKITRYHFIGGQASGTYYKL